MSGNYMIENKKKNNVRVNCWHHYTEFLKNILVPSGFNRFQGELRASGLQASLFSGFWCAWVVVWPFLMAYSALTSFGPPGLVYVRSYTFFAVPAVLCIGTF